MLRQFIKVQLHPDVMIQILVKFLRFVKSQNTDAQLLLAGLEQNKKGLAHRQSGLDNFVAVPGHATLNQDCFTNLFFIQVVEGKGLLGDCYKQTDWLEAFLKFNSFNFTAWQLNLFFEHLNQVKVLNIVFKSIILVKNKNTTDR